MIEREKNKNDEVYRNIYVILITLANYSTERAPNYSTRHKSTKTGHTLELK